MADESKVGTPWRDDELDAIVADYFVMLTADLAGKPYVKSRHSAALMSVIGRTHRSVEFKHQNISAVLDELGMPWIPGYIPKRNYQNAIFDAIDRYLSTHPAKLEPMPSSALAPPSSADVFVAPPILSLADAPIPERLRRLVQKFDPVARDYRNRSLGSAGEAFVVEFERRRLTDANRADLAQRVRWTAAEDGDGAGYDVSSFEDGGAQFLIEVEDYQRFGKNTVFLTRNELQVAKERPAEWRIYRVHLFASRPRIFTIVPPLESAVRLLPETWRAVF